jgi:hypothetical protein
MGTRPHVRRRWFLLAALSASAMALPAAHSQPVDDPVPLRRVWLDPERVPNAMKQVRLGVLKQLPSTEFEALVRRAGLAAASHKEPPRLIEARYRATLVDSALVGTGQWTVHNPGPGARILTLDPLNLAPRQPRFENRDALLADFDGAKPGLLLDERGRHAVSLDWTARGDPGPDGLRFEIKSPACAIASLEVNLPKESILSVSPDGCLLSGPNPAEAADRRLWRIGFAGKSQIYLTIRRTELDASGAPLLLAKWRSVQDLNPSGVHATFTLDLKAPRQEVRELRCECDPTLRPYEVTSPGLERWEIRAGATPNSPAILSIRYREPLRGGAVTIGCLAPLPASIWTSPHLRLVSAVPRGETLVLRVHPDVRLQDWRPGDFLLTRVATETDGTQVLTLVGGGLQSSTAPASFPARPSATIMTSGVEYRARQRTWWQVRPRMSSLTTQLAYEVARGQLLKLPLALPADWRVERVELNPSDLLLDWEIRQAGGPMLIVNLRKPLKSTSDGRPTILTVRLSSARPDHAPEWAFPDVRPVGVGFREGALAITFDEQDYRPAVAASVPAAEPPGGEQGPWGKQVPDLYYPYLGKVVEGRLRLQARAPQIRARCRSQVVVAAAGAAVVAHLELQPEIGSPDMLDVNVSAPAAGKWLWKTIEGDNQVLGFEPVLPPGVLCHLGALGAPNVLGSAIALSSAAAGGRAKADNQSATASRWRLTLARPLREPLRLDGSCELRRTGDGNRWDVPLVSLYAPNRMEGEVTLYLAGRDNILVETDGLREAASSGGPRTGVGTSRIADAAPSPEAFSPWRTFRYDAPPVFLSLHGRAASVDPARVAVFDRAVLTTYVEPSGRLLHHLAFQVWNWKQQTLPLRLGPDARLLAARVDGRWVGQLPTVEVMEDAALVKLPVPATTHARSAVGARHRFEIAYAQKRPSWRLWAELETPPSILPVAPVAFRHVWRLPPGVVPLFDNRYRCLPSAARDRSVGDGRVPFSLLSWPRAPRRWPLAVDWEPEQRQRMTEAAAALSKLQDAGTKTLGDMLDRLVFDHLKGGEGLILDAVALRDAGLGPETPLPAATGVGAPPTWESLGLVYVPCRPAPLLTTRREADAWQNAARLAGRAATAAPSESMEEAIAEAAVHGHDSSGRFVAAVHWLRGQGNNQMENGDQVAEKAESLDAVLGPLHSEYWTAWEPIAGAEADAPLLVVRRDTVPGAGIVLAVFLCVLFWRLPGPWRLGMVLLWLAASVCGFLWLPAVLRPLAWWPFIGGIVVALAAYLGAVARNQKAETRNPTPKTSGPVAVTTASLVLVLVSCFLLLDVPLGAADSPTEVTVFVVPAGDSGKPSVLAPPALLDRLNKLARQTAVPARGAVLVSANYEGKMNQADAEFRADFQVHCFGDETTTLDLPLDGVKILDDVLLDGARADVQVAQAPRVGYTLKVEKRSPPLHKVSMRFRVRVKRVGDERDLQFTVPSVIQGRLTFEQPPGARYLQALAGQTPVRGAQRLTTGQAPRLEADLGRLTAPLHLHWREGTAPPRPAAVRVKELYLWDLRADASTLTCVLAYAVAQGPISALAVNVPERLEVWGVEAEAPSARVPIRLKDWRLRGKGGERRLEVEFQGPVSGEVQLTLHLAPRGPLQARDTLPLPAPRQTQSNQRLVACQVSGLEAFISEHAGFVAMDPRDFARLWKAAGKVEPRASWPPMKAYAFERGANGQPELPVRLRPAASAARAEQDFTWRIGPGQAEFSATLRLVAADGDLALLEWEVPTDVVIRAVSGPGIHSWSRTGPRVQAWLRNSGPSAEAHVTGYRPTADGRFKLPCLPILSAAASSTTSLRLIASGGMTLTASEVRGLSPLPDPRTTGEELGYVSKRPRYGGSFRLVPASASADARILTITEVQERQLTFVAAVDYQPRQGEARTVVVELRNWEHGQAKLDVPDAMRPPRPQQRGTVHTWVVDLPPAQGGRCRMVLSGTLSLDETTGAVAMPVVSVSGAARTERWLAVGSPAELAVQAARGLRVLADPAHTLKVWWPREADQLRRATAPVWQVTADDWDLRLLPRARPAGAASVRVVLTEQASAVVDGRHWLHQTTYWLYKEFNSDLQVVLPSNARLLAVTLDDRPVATPRPEGGRLWLSLPGSAAAHRLRLRWRFNDNAETLERPLLTPPRLQGVVAGPVLWTVEIPAGYQLGADKNGTSAGAAVPACAAGQDLRRAGAQFQLSELLAGRARPSGADAALALAQKRFYHYCRYAEHDLERNSTGEVGPDGHSLRDWLQALLDQNKELAHKRGFEALRVEAERQARKGAYRSLPVAVAEPDEAHAGDTTPLAMWTGDAMPDHGTPAYWHGDANDAPPALVLTPARAQQTRQALGGSLVVVVLLLSAWLMAQFPGIRAWARMLWPEQMALLGCLVWQLFGLNLLVLFLVLLGVCARLVYLGQGLLRWVRRPSPAASA